MPIFRNRPSVVSGDNAKDSSPYRSSWYGDMYVQSVGTERQNAADEGSYYGISQPTLGTDIVGHVAPTLANNDPTPTKTLLHIYNGGQKNICLDFITLRWVIVNASSTATGFLVYTDQLNATGRTSGGTQVTPANSRVGGAATGAVVYFGAVVTAAAAAVNRHFAKYIRPVIAVATDEATFNFGGDKAGAQAAVALNGTSVAVQTVNVPPVCVVPGGNFYLCEANPSGAATGATYHFTGGWIER